MLWKNRKVGFIALLFQCKFSPKNKRLGDSVLHLSMGSERPPPPRYHQPLPHPEVTEAQATHAAPVKTISSCRSSPISIPKAPRAGLERWPSPMEAVAIYLLVYYTLLSSRSVKLSYVEMNMLSHVKTPIWFQIPQIKSSHFSQRPRSMKTVQQSDGHCESLLSVIFRGRIHYVTLKWEVTLPAGTGRARSLGENQALAFWEVRGTHPAGGRVRSPSGLQLQRPCLRVSVCGWVYGNGCTGQTMY